MSSSKNIGGSINKPFKLNCMCAPQVEPAQPGHSLCSGRETGGKVEDSRQMVYDSMVRVEVLWYEAKEADYG